MFVIFRNCHSECGHRITELNGETVRSISKVSSSQCESIAGKDLMSASNGRISRLTAMMLAPGLSFVLALFPFIAKVGDQNRGLTHASMNGDVDKVISLLDSGADINAKDQRDWTPLLWAVSRGQIDVVKLLLDKGADFNAKGEHGWTPLMESANRGHSEVAKLLLKKGADVNLKHEYGWTARSIAKAKGNKKIFEVLKDHGAK